VKKVLLGFLAIVGLTATLSMAAIPPDVPADFYTPGDINGNGQGNGIDITFGVAYFKGGPPPPRAFDCTGAMGLFAEADVNGNCAFNGIDITYFVAYLKGGPGLQFCQNCLRDSVIVTDADVAPGQTVTWESHLNYILNGFVFVDSTATLNIEPGCVVKGHPGQAENASAIIVARGGTINANGTVDAPIIFTCSSDWADDLNSIPFDFKGQWGGLIVLGNATTNHAGGFGRIEGIPETETRGEFGGANDDDNSGIIRYVSIRHGGSIIGANNEVNGLTMGAVGRGTTIEFVEVFANLDDGFEWFGGTVDCRNIISVWNDDDNFDYDTGWRGRGQFWACLQNPADGNRGGEHDGGITPNDAFPWSNPYIANVTFIGSGMSGTNPNNDWAYYFDDFAGGHYWGGIYADFGKRGMTVEDNTNPNDARVQWERDSIRFDYTIWSKFGYASLGQADSLFPQSFVATQIVNPAYNATLLGNVDVVAGISRTPGSHGLNPRPVAPYNAAIPAPFGGVDPWFTPTTYYGAFDPSPAVPLWTDGWTYLSKLGFTQ
jgi:hypothetical protein